MILAIASGKGGTGKTTVAVNLARLLDRAELFDCDVEEPNSGLFIGGEMTGERVVSVKIPIINDSVCDGCGECSRFCRFNAIAAFGTTPVIFPSLCHGCGGCAMVCPLHAITEVDRRVGVVQVFKSGSVTLTQGLLDVGQAMAPPVIRAVKERISANGTVAILDAPPGSSCPVVATLREADYALLVTEPTPFGLHDLKLAVETARLLDIPCGVVVNRAGSSDRGVYDYCRREEIEILAEIPEDRRIAECYSRGALLVDELPEYRELFGKLLELVRQ